MAGQAAGGSASQGGGGGVGSFLWSGLRAFVVYVLISQVTRAFIKPPARQGQGGDQGEVRPLIRPAVTTGDVLTLRVFLTDTLRDLRGQRPHWEYTSFISGSDTDVYASIEVEGSAIRNANLQAVCVVEYVAGSSSSGEPIMRELALAYPLTERREKKQEKAGQNLMSSSEVDQGREARVEKDSGPPVMATYWKGNLTVSLLSHEAVYPLGQQVQPPVDLFLRQDEETETYAPFVFLHNFWLLEDQMTEMNETTSSKLTLGIRLHELPLWKAAVYLQMEKSWELQEKMGLSNKKQAEELKRMFLETNPYFLALTTIVSLLHTVFDMLAFKSDIGFWSKNESMKGLSARSILINCSCQVVIFLYLLENETSTLILFSNGLGLMIEFWKVTKACKVERVMLKGFIPFLTIKDRESYATSKTKTYDQEASRYLSYVLYPLVAGYAGYSLMYETHKSWYSWILSSLVGAVYTFGFILMCPQLYINYRMKSVAHLPWRQMTYKFLNTIIDDLFAFVIKMPTLHRLSVFRDDVIFLIQLYQRWIYRVDKTRTNEFGYSEEKEKIEKDGGEEEAKKEK